MIALQSQMDPHFLYNVMAVISSAGREADAPRVCDICRAMTAMLRYVGANDEELVPLRSELEHARKYLQLMQYRYESQLVFELDLPPEGLEELYVPKLCVQPLVENSFNHGFKKSSPPWRVKVFACREGNAWSVTVADNGGGFAAGALEAATQRAESFATRPQELIGSFKIGGMGLANILSRFKLRYGAGMIFKAERNKGITVVTIGGPVK
jgi:sensor histidine kinase YesM